MVKKYGKTGKIALSFLLAAVVLVSAGSLSIVKADTSAISDFTLPTVTGPYNINACFGNDSTKLNFSWFTQSAATTQIKFAPTATFSSSTTPQDATQVTVKATEAIDVTSTVLPDTNGVPSASNFMDGFDNGNAPAPLATGEYENTATASNLTAGTQYSYSVSDGKGNWSPVYTVSTPSASSISFAAVGDPQIGAFDDAAGTAKDDSTGGHTSVTDDETGWGNMLKLVTQNTNLNFILSLGDQVDDYTYLDTGKDAEGGQFDQYSYFFNPDSSSLLQNYPLVALNGNHDHQMGEYYGYHYDQPNKSTLGATQYGNDGDYYFTAGPVLFLVLDANDYGTADHDQFIGDAIKATANDGIKWKVAAWHQSAYSDANHNTNNETDDPVLTIRNTWPAIMDKYGIDVVLQGHDHFYTRSAQMLGGSVVDPTTGAPEVLTSNSGSTVPGATNVNATFSTKQYPDSVTNPKGTVYFTLDSGSGSKYYNLNSGTNQTLNTSADHSFSVVGWQGYIPTYSYISFTDTTFTIKTYSTTDYKIADQSQIDSYTITKTTNTAADNGTTGNSPNPKTGDSTANTISVILSIAVIALLLGSFSFMVLRRKKAED